jgi:hypothetical protein
MRSRSILFDCRQSRRRPVNGGGVRCAELDVGVWLKEGELLVFSCIVAPASARWPRSAAALAAVGLARFD